MADMDWNRPTEALVPGLDGVVLSVLFAVDSPQTVGDIHQRARTGSRSGIRYVLDKLTGQGVVVKTPVANTATYVLNVDHVAYPALKAGLGTYRPYNELRNRLHDLMHSLDTAWANPAGPALMLYGSVTRGEADTSSDIDLLLVIPTGHDLDDPQVEALVEQLHDAVPRWTGNPAHVDVRTRGDVDAAVLAGDPIVESWRRDGDIVFETEPVAGLRR